MSFIHNNYWSIVQVLLNFDGHYLYQASICFNLLSSAVSSSNLLTFWQLGHPNPQVGLQFLRNRLSPPLIDSPLRPVLHCRQLHGYKTHLLKRGFHTFKNNASFSSPTSMGSHNPLDGPLSVGTLTNINRV